ncbi:hypothetical protein NKI95_27045 [Mesorhizobium sp. M0306]|uniref:glycogen debranching N-terminal domain-containing protein n=1 Tax=Mesorhizobium sp. M0306 TaxID=2956932 RepID=UPI003337E8DB
MLERITFTNYSAHEIALPVRLHFDADFRDMFEVRGTTRSRRGRAHDALIGETSVTFRYEGLDNVARQSVIAFFREAGPGEFQLHRVPHCRAEP